ncbi:DUF5924 family protein [Gilvimarinus xylanilyticus]|uniref:DUF2914 domain-containing protein n=1 Tax=Gilvimarinus xylanilyticus TaxID=2944139 RepID=A0A9X2I5X7_9GAMM|nr:DUF5924 family protein [Gilvimarinus xylanilyticus]MCP8900037.1 DUF2914 domain-containing protein [Gilvimarinus xylanilyticus]
MSFVKRIFSLLARLAARYPGLLALVGFVSGVASFFLVEREQDKFAQLVSLLMVGGWFLLMLENLLKRGVSHWFGAELPDPVVRFATQMVHQESLFFVIPFFFITTAWNSGQLVFTGLLMAMAAISVIDPIYYKWLAPRRWLYFFYHGFTLFAVLLTALPILLHIPTAEAYRWSLGIATVLSFLNMVRDLSFAWWRRAALALGLVAAAAAVGVLARPWVPPANLWLTQVAITPSINNREKAPEKRLKALGSAQLEDGLYAYTAIHAPRGLRERIYHVWRLNGKTVDKIPLDINGGREAGYRAWSHKLNFPPYPQGNWRIDVVTEANQVIGVLRFSVSDNPQASEEAQEKTLPEKVITSPAELIRDPIVDTLTEEGQALLDNVLKEKPAGETD